MCPVVPAALATEPRYSYYRHTLTLTGSIVRATLIVLLTSSLCMVHAPFAAAQGVKPSAPPAYPSRVIRIVLPGSPGAGSDIIGRILAQPLSKTLGQNVVIDNRPGAANIIAAKSAPDGYTLLIGTTGTFVTNPLVYAKLPYSINDFAAISNAVEAAFLLAVHPSVPAKNVTEIVALAKARPGQMAIASFGIGSSTHFAGELFQSMTKTKLVHVPYKGSAPGVVDLVAGNIAATFDTILTLTPYIQSRRVRPLGLAAAKRLKLVPDMPTLAEQGLKDFEAGSWYGLLAPAGTPREIVTRLHAETVAALKLPEVQKRFTELGTDIIGNSPEEFTNQIRNERAKWAKVAQDAGIKPE
jgi:tripartite-type tricarboxylate transporter receptor subunit TctC